MFFSKKSKQPVLTLDYYGDMDFNININKKLSSNHINNIASFIFLLTYQSPICATIIEHIQSKNNDNNNNNIDKIINAWTTIYLADRNNPIVSPILAFKKNVK